jgi:hypothetical protein
LIREPGDYGHAFADYGTVKLVSDAGHVATT